LHLVDAIVAALFKQFVVSNVLVASSPTRLHLEKTQLLHSLKIINCSHLGVEVWNFTGRTSNFTIGVYKLVIVSIQLSKHVSL
jgi:hypothetical protein